MSAPTRPTELHYSNRTTTPRHYAIPADVARDMIAACHRMYGGQCDRCGTSQSEADLSFVFKLGDSYLLAAWANNFPQALPSNALVESMLRRLRYPRFIDDRELLLLCSSCKHRHRAYELVGRVGDSDVSARSPLW